MSFMNNAQASVQRATADIPEVMRRVYLWMTFGLLLTAGTAATVAQTGWFALTQRNPVILLVALLAEIGMVMYLSVRIARMQPATAALLFMAYAVLNGVTLSFLFYMYTETSIVFAAIAAGRDVWCHKHRCLCDTDRPVSLWRHPDSRSDWPVCRDAGQCFPGAKSGAISGP